MDTNADMLTKALEDIANIRRAIEKTDGAESATAREALGITAATRWRVLVGAFVLALFFLGIELVTGFGVTRGIQVLAAEPKMRTHGLLHVAFLLAVFLGVTYSVVWHAARTAGQSFERYVSRNFNYLQNLSLFSDVFVRLVMVVLFILAQQPLWVAPVLLLFTGDFLIQGKLFLIPVNVSLIGGLLCIVGAAVQFTLGSGSLVFPLAVFALACGASLYTLRRSTES